MGTQQRLPQTPKPVAYTFLAIHYIWANLKATVFFFFLIYTLFLYQQSAWNISEVIQQFPSYPTVCLLLTHSVFSLLWTKVPLGTKSFIILSICV